MKIIYFSRLFLYIILFLLFMIPQIHSQVKNQIDVETRTKVKQVLLNKYGEAAKFRIERGVEQTANLWIETDGTKEEFAAFCDENFAGTDTSLESLFNKIEYYDEILRGSLTEITLGLKQYLDLDWGDVQPIDLIMGGYDPTSHLSEDLFNNKFAFIITLNFPDYTLNEKITLGSKWSRLEWAYARIGRIFETRIPADINQKITTALTEADSYISEYNIYMNNLVGAEMKPLFPKEMKLISHWGLRDELKSHFGNPGELPKQEMIYAVMKRIISQEIPKVVVNSDKYQWNPLDNKVFENGKEINAEAEPDTRYIKYLNVFKALYSSDKYYPEYNTYIKRSFDGEREVSFNDVEKTFGEFLSSTQVKKVADLIKKRLSRNLEPFDIWYTGFKSRINTNEEELDKITKEKYPTPEAFEKDIVNILLKLGFTENDAQYISEKIQVDPARGSGHAFGSAMRKFKSHLRTRIGKDGMNYKGYNIAVHELGHNVEETLTLYKIDYYSLYGVPNTAFTEAMAFLFQSRDLELLGIKNDDPQAKYLSALDNFWNTYEIMGVSLVDMHVWEWLYKHPDATPQELKTAVINSANEVWNKYYADVFGVKDQPIFAIYSHMIDNALYLPNYALGYLIEFQIEDYMKDKVIGPEMMRMCASGNIIPQQWMKNAVGSEISIKPMLKAVDEALLRVQ